MQNAQSAKRGRLSNPAGLMTSRCSQHDHFQEQASSGQMVCCLQYTARHMATLHASADSCMLSPWNSGAARAAATERAICTLPATSVEPMRSTMYLDGVRAASSGLSGWRCTRTCGVGGRGGSQGSDMLATMGCLVSSVVEDASFVYWQSEKTVGLAPGRQSVHFARVV